MCHSERTDDCRRGPIIGFQLPGCFAERALLPAIALVKVDDRISDSEAATLQSLSDSIAGVETAQIRPGDSVAVFGQGSMGIESMQAARACGAGQLITVDVRPEACEISLALGSRLRNQRQRGRSRRGDPRPDRRRGCRRGIRVRRRQRQAGTSRRPGAQTGHARGALWRQAGGRLLVRGHP